jgi:hypothetical protein
MEQVVLIRLRVELSRVVDLMRDDAKTPGWPLQEKTGVCQEKSGFAGHSR